MTGISTVAAVATEVGILGVGQLKYVLIFWHDTKFKEAFTVLDQGNNLTVGFSNYTRSIHLHYSITCAESSSMSRAALLDLLHKDGVHRFQSIPLPPSLVVIFLQEAVHSGLRWVHNEVAEGEAEALCRATQTYGLGPRP